MIAETGLAALWLAAMLAGLQLILAWVSVGKGDARAARLMRPVALAQGALTAISFALLITLFLRSGHVGTAGRDQQPFDEAVHLQVRRNLGQS